MIEINGRLYAYDVSPEEFAKMDKKQQEAVQKEHDEAIIWARKIERQKQENDNFANSWGEVDNQF